MVKKVVLLFTLVLYFAFVQSTVMAQDQYNRSVYLNNLQKKIESNWLTPRKSIGKSAIISFIVNRDGSISNVEVLRSSRDLQFDESVMNAICKSAPFGPLANDENTFSVQFYFSPTYTSMTTAADKRQLFDSSNATFNVANKSTNTSADIDFTNYTDSLQKKINSNWATKDLKTSIEAMADIKINKDGSLDNVELLKSSSKRKVDNEVLDAISKSVPIDALPDGFNYDSQNVQLTFNYNYSANDNTSEHHVIASINVVNGYDKYTKQVNDIINNILKGKSYYLHKDLLLEISIDKTGRVKYARIQKPSQDSNFDRKILATIQKLAFPPIPEEMNLDNVTLSYEFVTQRDISFPVVIDFILNLGSKQLKSFCI